MLPNSPASVKFAVIGDSGRGTTAQREVADQMVRYHQQFAFPFTIMLGDNLYEGAATPDDYRAEVRGAVQGAARRRRPVLCGARQPRRPARDPLRAVQHERPPLLLASRRRETSWPGITTPVEFFALDSTYLDREQLAWLDKRLAASAADWKIVLPPPPDLHLRPLPPRRRWSSARPSSRSSSRTTSTWCSRATSTSTSARRCRAASSTSSAVAPDRCGPATACRRPYIARTYSGDYHFMLVEIEGDDLHFQAISRTGRTIDAGTLSRTSRHAAGARAITALGTAGRR